MEKMITVLMCAILILVICLPVSAHPGGTDGAGGHINSANGEYHYHHGHAAHQHYDMDGDGKKDCPYNYNDASKKNNSSGSSSESCEYISPTIDPEIMEDLEKTNDEMRALMESIAENDKEYWESMKKVEEIEAFRNSPEYTKYLNEVEKSSRSESEENDYWVIIPLVIMAIPFLWAIFDKYM